MLGSVIECTEKISIFSADEFSRGTGHDRKKTNVFGADEVLSNDNRFC